MVEEGSPLPLVGEGPPLPLVGVVGVVVRGTHCHWWGRVPIAIGGGGGGGGEGDPLPSFSL